MPSLPFRAQSGKPGMGSRVETRKNILRPFKTDDSHAVGVQRHDLPPLMESRRVPFGHLMTENSTGETHPNRGSQLLSSVEISTGDTGKLQESKEGNFKPEIRGISQVPLRWLGCRWWQRNRHGGWLVHAMSTPAPTSHLPRVVRWETGGGISWRRLGRHTQ